MKMIFKHIFKVFHDPLVLIGFALYLLLIALLIGRLLIFFCADDDEPGDHPGGRRKSSLGRRLRHFSWDANALGGGNNGLAKFHRPSIGEKGEQCVGSADDLGSIPSRPTSPTIPAGQRRISVVSGFPVKPFLTVPNN